MAHPQSRRLYLSEGPISVVTPRAANVHLRLRGRDGVLIDTLMTGVRSVEVTNGTSGSATVGTVKVAPVAKKTVSESKQPSRGPKVRKIGRDVHVTLPKRGESGYNSWHDHKALIVGKDAGFPEGRFVVKVSATEIYESVKVPGSYLSSFSGFFATHPELKGGETLVFKKVTGVVRGGRIKPCYELTIVGASKSSKVPKAPAVARAPVSASKTLSVELHAARGASGVPTWKNKGVLTIRQAERNFFPPGTETEFLVRDGNTRHMVRIPDGYMSGLTGFFNDHSNARVGQHVVFKRIKDETKDGKMNGLSYHCFSVRIV